jgi:FkbM family methyltransferase
MNKSLSKILTTFLNRDFIQKNLEKIYPRLLKIMNYGTGGDFETSGELNVLYYINKSLKETRYITVFDVGANIGNYSLAAHNILKHRELRIFSFEPAKETFIILSRNLKGSDNIIPVNSGLSNKISVQKLYSNHSSSGLASVYNRRLSHFDIELNKYEEINLTTIDNFCDENGITSIDFLKIDVEGHELKVLHGAKKMIRESRIRFIQFEFGGCNIDSRTFFQDFFYLLKDKYKIYKIMPKGLYQIDEYKEAQEIFLTVNYFAELR